MLMSLLLFGVILMASLLPQALFSVDSQCESRVNWVNDGVCRNGATQH